MRQAESLCEPELDETGRDAMGACLGTQIGIATSGVKGRQIRRAIRERRDRLLTKAGRPTAQYGKLIERAKALVTEVAALDERRCELASTLTQLEETERAIRRFQREDEESALLHRLEEARASLQRSRQHAGELEVARQAAEGAQARLEETKGERQRRDDLARQLEDLRSSEADLRRKGRTAQASVAEVDRALEEVRQEQMERKAQRRAVDTERDRLSRLREFAREASNLVAREAVLEQLLKLQERARAVRAELEENRLSRELLQRLREADSGLERAKAHAAGAATHVGFDLVPDALARVCVNGEHLNAPDTELQVLEPARITIDGIGAIDIRPQIRGAQQIERKVEQAEADLRHLLEAAGVADLEAAGRDAARREQLCLELGHLVNETERLVRGDENSALEPGVDALAAHLEAKRAMLQQAMAELGVEGAADLVALTAELECKSEELRTLDRRTDEIDAYATRMSDERRLAGEHAATCTTELRATLDQLKQTEDRLAMACANRNDETLREQSERWTKEHAEALQRERELAARDVPEPPLAEQTVARLEPALEEHRRDVAALANQCAALRATIEAREGEGLEETIAAERGELARTEADIRVFKDEADALVLLDAILSDAELEARDRYLEPVVKKLRPHLSHRCPGAAAQLDEQFKICTLIRDRTEEPFAQLSDGTREQLAVLTRLALAELLLDQGKPAMLMLDDALVFSDDDRIERMFDILNRAAERLQILVFTCRTRSFRRLGGHTLALGAVRDSAPHMLEVA